MFFRFLNNFRFQRGYRGFLHILHPVSLILPSYITMVGIAKLTLRQGIISFSSNGVSCFCIQSRTVRYTHLCLVCLPNLWSCLHLSLFFMLALLKRTVQVSYRTSLSLGSSHDFWWLSWGNGFRGAGNTTGTASAHCVCQDAVVSGHSGWYCVCPLPEDGVCQVSAL